MWDPFSDIAKITTVKAHRALTVKNSNVEDGNGGLGLFVDMSQINGHSQPIELLRIPVNATFDKNTILASLSDPLQYLQEDAMRFTKETVKAMLGNVYTCIMDSAENARELMLSEKNILVAYMVIFELIRNDLVGAQLQLPRLLNYYLTHVLSQTKTDILISQKDLTRLLYPNDLRSQVDMAFLEILKASLSQYVADEGLLETISSSIFSKVVSRCLEIPSEFNKNSNDYTVQTTLVPLLDFANHDNAHKNAYYDVDRKTQEILLIFDPKNVNNKHEGEEEIFISYAPEEDLFDFAATYGFLPKPNYGICQVWNMEIDRTFLSRPDLSGVALDLRLFYKWFNINPVIQLVFYRGEWFVNDTLESFQNLLLPFCKNSGKKYPKWTYAKDSYKSFAYFYKILTGCKDTEIRDIAANYKAALRYQELEPDEDCIAAEQLAWTLHLGEDERKRPTIEEAREILGTLLVKDLPYLMRFMQWRLLNLSKHVKESEQTIYILIQHEIHIITDIINRINQGHNVLLSTLQVKLQFRIPLPCTSLGQSQQELVVVKHDDNKYNPCEYSTCLFSEFVRYCQHG